jgi:hypothetical protein
MHGNIINVSTNFNLIQNVLPWMPYDDFSISIFLKKKLEYKFIYISSYVHPNIVMKTLQQIYRNLLYMNANVSI